MRSSAQDLLPDIKGGESNPPLYYVLAWGWSRVWGDGAFALRSLSWVFGVATIPAAYAAAATLSSRRIGVITAALTAVSPLLVWYSTEARAYALLVLLSTLSLLTFARTLVRSGHRDLVLWALTACMALSTHYFAAFLIDAEAAVLLERLPSLRRSVVLALVPVSATAFLLLPLAFLQRELASWIERIPLGVRLEEVGRNFLTGVSAPGWGLEVVVAALVISGLLLLACADSLELRSAAVWFAVSGLALGLPLTLAIVGLDYVLTRNLIAVWVPLVFVVATGCGARRAGAFGLGVASAVAAASLAIVIAIAVDTRLQRVNWDQAATLLGPERKDRMILAWGDYRLAPLFDEFGHPRQFASGERIRVREIDLLGFSSPTGRSCWSGAACNMYGVDLEERVELPGFTLVERRRAGLFEVTRYRSRRAVSLAWRDISAAVGRYGAPYAFVEDGDG